MSRSLSSLKLSVAVLSVMGASLLMPSALANEDSIAVSEESLETSPSIDYSMMEKFMNRASTRERGRPSIAYKSVREENLEFFDDYEAHLVSIDSAALNENDRLAYWLNVQNFLVVKAVTQDTKTTKLKSLRGTGTKPGKMWTNDRVTIGGQSYSIADIDSKITSEFQDPNVIYGLYQGVKGGPCISSTPYQGETVHARLAELGMQYVNSQGIVEPEKSVVTVTPIYDWYKADLFENDDKILLKHLKANADTHLRGRLNRAHEVKFTKLNYATDNFDLAKAIKDKKSARKKAKGRSAEGPRQRAPQRVPQSGGSGGSYGS